MESRQFTSLIGGLVLLATSVFIASCSDDMTEPQVTTASNQPVSFRVQDNSKKVTATTENNITNFVVSAEASFQDSPNELLFDAAVVYRKEINGQDYNTSYIWDYNSKVYYPIGTTSAQYFAYSPVSNNVINGIGYERGNRDDLTDYINDRQLSYTVPSSIESQEDFMLAYTKKMFSSYSNYSDTVKLNFKHALARVFVSGINTTYNDVTVHNIALMNLSSTGILEYSSSYSQDYENCSWSYVNHSERFNYFYKLPEMGIFLPFSQQGNVIPLMHQNQGMMVMPQYEMHMDMHNLSESELTCVYDYYDGINKNVDDYDGYDDCPYYHFCLAVEYTMADVRYIAYISPQKYIGLVFEAGKQYNLVVIFTERMPEITSDLGIYIMSKDSSTDDFPALTTDEDGRTYYSSPYNTAKANTAPMESELPLGIVEVP